MPLIPGLLTIDIKKGSESSKDVVTCDYGNGDIYTGYHE